MAAGIICTGSILSRPRDGSIWHVVARTDDGPWRGNDKLIESACGKPRHPDEASMVIIEAVWSALQRED